MGSLVNQEISSVNFVILLITIIIITVLFWFVFQTCCQVTSVVSDSVRPHRQQPTRLPCPWDSPGKNTGVGCHFLLQRVKVKSLSRVRLFATPWTAARQASLSITNSRSLLKLMSIESVMPSNHLILCCPLLLLPSIFPSIRVFSNESALHISWPKDWSFSFNILPVNTQD